MKNSVRLKMIEAYVRGDPVKWIIADYCPTCKKRLYTALRAAGVPFRRTRKPSRSGKPSYGKRLAYARRQQLVRERIA